MLSTNDIQNDLGVKKTTVSRWIREGKLKAHKNSNRNGWMITDTDYEEFLKKNSKWESIREGAVFTKDELKIRKNLLETISNKIKETDALARAESRVELYMKGYERAMNELRIVLNRELIRRAPM